MKKFKLDSRNIQFGLTLLIVAIISIAFCYFIYHGETVSEFFSNLFSILAPIIYGLLISFLLIPMVNFFEHRVFLAFIPRKIKDEIAVRRVETYDKMKEASDEEKAKYLKRIKRRFTITRAASILLTMLIVALLVYGFLYSVIPQIRDSISSIVSKSGQYYENVNKYINNLAAKHPELAEGIKRNWDLYYDEIISWRDNTLIPKIKEWVVSASQTVMNVFSTAWNLIIGLIISIYIMASKEKFCAQFKKIFYALFGVKGANNLIDNIRFVNQKFSGFIVGKLVDSVIIGVITLICCYIFKFDYPVLIALIIGVTNIIPFFGPIFGAIPCVILLFMINPLKALYFIIFVILLQQFDGNILGPKILGESTGVSGFWVIVAITFFGGIWGVPGMIVGVPLFAVIYAALKFLIDSKLSKKNLPLDTLRYFNLDRINDETGAMIKHPPGYMVKQSAKEPKELKAFNLFKKHKDHKDDSASKSAENTESKGTESIETKEKTVSEEIVDKINEAGHSEDKK